MRRSELLPRGQVKTWPVWAQRHIVLGLDLQGGSYLLLEVDSNYVKKDKLDQVRDDVRRVLREAKIGYTGLAVRDDTVEVRITKDTDLPTALTKLRELSQPLGGLLGSSGQRSLEVTRCRRRADPPRPCRRPRSPTASGRRSSSRSRSSSAASTSSAPSSR